MEILFFMTIAILFLYCLVNIFLKQEKMKFKIFRFFQFIVIFVVMIYFSSWLEFIMHPSQLTFKEYLIAEEWHQPTTSNHIESFHDLFGYFVATIIACLLSEIIKRKK